MPPPRPSGGLGYVVPGIIAEGLTLLAGKPKIGKSWLLLGMALAVAGGGHAFGSINVDEGDVLYLALEDNERRLQSRLKKLLSYKEAPRRLFIDVACPRLDQGLLDNLREWVNAVPNARLIIIDVLNRIRPAQKPSEGIYDYDVRSLGCLQALAAEFGIAVIVVHHSRKADADDPFDCLSGSTGLPATADSTFLLARDSQGVTLYGRGRDIEEVERALSFDGSTGQWLILGEAAEIRRSGERGAILQALEDATEPMSPVDVAEVTGFKRDNVKKLLRHMAKAGEAESLGARKGYVHPLRRDLLPPGSRGYRVTRDGE
jgi:RecA-family ATPase